MASLLQRGSTYYAQYYVGPNQRRVCLHTDSLQIAKEKLRRIESAQLVGDALPLTTRTPLAEVVGVYVEYLRAAKSPCGALKDSYYLRDCFGPVCPTLAAITKAKRARPRKLSAAERQAVGVLEVGLLEQLTTAQMSEWIARRVRARGLSPKTANRFREILCRLINWATKQRGVRMPGGVNPAAALERYRERAPEIEFLTMPQIGEQLESLRDRPDLRAMVAVYIYAGLRREEALWLRRDDVDLAGGLIRVCAKSVDGETWQPKTARNRSVPISRALAGILRTYLEGRASLWCFASPQGHRWDPDNFSAALRDANERVGLRWTCLHYRHTFGSQLAMKGESLYKIATLMGNSAAICQRHYAALLPHSLVGSVEFSASG